MTLSMTKQQRKWFMPVNVQHFATDCYLWHFCNTVPCVATPFEQLENWSLSIALFCSTYIKITSLRRHTSRNNYCLSCILRFESKSSLVLIEVPFNSRRSGQINKYIRNITRTMINTNITNKQTWYEIRDKLFIVHEFIQTSMH